MASLRMAKVSELIQQELGQLMARELELPRGCLVTITRVKTSNDLSYSDVYISILPTANTKDILGILENNRRHLQAILAKNITIANFPTLRFHPDATEDKAERIEGLIDSLKHSR